MCILSPIIYDIISRQTLQTLIREKKKKKKKKKKRQSINSLGVFRIKSHSTWLQAQKIKCSDN